MNVLRWFELALRIFDRAISPFLWCVFAAAIFRAAIDRNVFAGETVALFVFLTFATTFARAVRATAATWRAYPYWLDFADSDVRDRATSAPILATGAVWTLNASASGNGVGRVFFAFCLLVVVDLIARRWARRVVEKSARNFRAFFDVEKRGASSSAEIPAFDAISLETIAAPTSLSREFQRDGSDALVEFGTSSENESGALLASQRRTRTADGAQQIVGDAAVEFEDDAEIATLYLSFCPPFDGVPTFQFEQISGVDVELKTTSVQPFGVRLEAKRRLTSAAATADEEIRVEYFATFPRIDE